MTEPRRRYAQNNMSDLGDEESLLPSPSSEKATWRHRRSDRQHPPRDPIRTIVVGLVMTLIFLLTLVYWVIIPTSTNGFSLPQPSSCDTIDKGYQCEPSLSHTWGQYSPYYVVDSEVSSRPPDGCRVTFAQLLSRHGARYPTKDKSRRYNDTIAKIQSRTRNFSGPFAFLQQYTYDLGADDLTTFGEQELVNSGIDFFTRYESLSATSTPFIRASGKDRVLVSAKMWSDGFHNAKTATGVTNDAEYPYSIVEISEERGMNNTLSHGNCAAFEDSKTGMEAQRGFLATFLPAITARLSSALGPQVDLDDTDTITLMDMCPFTVVARSTFPSSSKSEAISTTTSHPTDNPFCALFTHNDWQNYDYYQTLGKYYAFGPGSPLGPTQGIGFVHELIARLTSSPVQDSTTVNHTLDSDPATFPLARSVYADFSHDNDMTSIFAALGLFNNTPPLSQRKIMTMDEMRGYSASRTVPFAARMVVEKLQCEVEPEELVRVLVNGRVLPLETCGGHDEMGRCKLGKFVESLGFATRGGRWNECSAGRTTRDGENGLLWKKPVVTEVGTER
ncbi:MAG: hypothetical protein Q9217_002025 [Psora testacea]